jgi:hypothetical protein
MKPGSKKLHTLIGAIVIASASGAAIVEAQGRGGGEWTTSQGDAQRSSWVRTDVRLTRDAVQKGELKFLWKMKLDNETRQINSLTTPVLMDRLISHRGFKALAFIGASGERVYAVDTDLARVYWTTIINYSSITPPANSSWACPGGLTAAITRPTAFAVSAFGGGRGGGRGGGSGSSVGEPGKGAPSLALVSGRGAAPGDPVPAGPPAGRGATPGDPAPAGRGAAPAGRGGGGGGLGGGPNDNILVVASDGFARTINPHNGSDRVPPVPFLPANARPSDLIAVDGVLYTTTSNGCGAAPNGVWAIDLAGNPKTPVSWKTNGGNVAGAAGLSMGTDGTIFVAVGDGASSGAGAASASYSNSVVSLEPKTLKLKESFTQPGADLNSSPLVFRYKDKDLMAVSGNDGRLYLLDGSSLKTPLYVTPKYSNVGAPGGLATWESDGTRWILAPSVGSAHPGMKVAANGPVTNGSIVAFKLVDAGGKLSLEPAWASRDLTSPATPLIFNGVAFVLSTGEHRPVSASAGSAQRAKASVPAVLYALDPGTGKELWSSGKTITSFARGGLSAAAGQVYLVTFDNTLYAFGIPMEH